MFITLIHCDACERSCALENIEPKWLVVKAARGTGWSVGKWHLCPECKKRKKELIKGGVLS